MIDVVLTLTVEKLRDGVYGVSIIETKLRKAIENHELQNEQFVVEECTDFETGKLTLRKVFKNIKKKNYLVLTSPKLLGSR